MNRLAAVKIIVIFLSVWAVNIAFAECINEDACFKDYIKDKNNEDVVLAVNRDTEEVELYWSYDQKTWLKPDTAYKKELQKSYDKKYQLKKMQAELDRMRRESYSPNNQQPLDAGRRGR